MREIKFRAWLSTKNKMKSWDDICLDEFHGEISVCSLLVDDYANLKVMQFTGMKDKNGTEIYEGDILRRQKPNNDGTPNGNTYKTVTWASSAKSQGFGIGKDSTYEVVGNIYENPELLELAS